MFKSILIKKDNDETRLYDLQEFSFLMRGNIKDMINVMYNGVLKGLKPSYNEHVSYHNHEKMDGVILIKYQVFNGVILCICKNDINIGVLSSLFRSIIVKNTKIESIDDLNKKYVDVDKITKVNVQLNETKNILVESIDKLLKNGETIEQLVDKSADLSMLSKDYYKKTKKLNKCCVIL